MRELGALLGLPREIIWRQPFPGPGLAIRVLGEVTEERLALLREADAIVQDEMRQAGLERELWQAFAVLLPVRTVGVMGDFRTYAQVIALRAVHEPGRHDRRLGAAALRPAREDLEPHHQRGQGRQPRRLRHLLQAPEHHRVGVVPAGAAHSAWEAGTPEAVRMSACAKEPNRQTEVSDVQVNWQTACAKEPNRQTEVSDVQVNWQTACAKEPSRQTEILYIQAS